MQDASDLTRMAANIIVTHDRHGINPNRPAILEVVCYYVELLVIKKANGSLMSLLIEIWEREPTLRTIEYVLPDVANMFKVAWLALQEQRHGIKHPIAQEVAWRLEMEQE